MRRAAWAWAGLVALALPWEARAQEAPPPPEPEDQAEAADEAAREEAFMTAEEELDLELLQIRLDQSTRLLEQLQAQNRLLEKQLKKLKRDAGMPVADDNVGLKPFGHVTVRYDNIWTRDPNDVLILEGADVLEVSRNQPRIRGYIDGFRTKVRFGAKYLSPDGLVVGGLRLAVAQNPNPASSFTALGSGFTTTAVGMDQYWLGIRPVKADRERLLLAAGKMPLPFWRGGATGLPFEVTGDKRGAAGGFATEMIWDNDISPAGVAGIVKLWGNEKVWFGNTLGYFVLNDFEDVRFTGLTGEIQMIAEQLLVKAPFVNAAFSFYDIENVNAGLRAPAVDPNQALLVPGQTAYLLRTGFQGTNNRVNYGPGADGFRVDAFRMLNLTAQGILPFEGKGIGKGSAYLLVDFVANLIPVSDDKIGVAGTVGLSLGAHDAKLKPLNLWFTGRYVDADAAIGALADSDLGRGTEYWGFEVTGVYAPAKPIKVLVSYFDFLRFPNKDVRERRLFLDLIADF